MAVKRIKEKGTGPKRKAPVKKRPAPVIDKAQVAKIALPSQAKDIVEDLFEYITLIWGREKIGKTTAFASWPGAIFFATEPGTKGLEVFEFNHENGGVTSWEVFIHGVDLLIETADDKQFNTVIIDTVDNAYELCLDYVCRELKIEYPGTDSSGDNDYGKSWKAIKMEFTYQIQRLVQAGYGLGFTSHAKTDNHKTQSGDRYDRVYPSMSNQARTVIEALVDFFFYAEYAKTQDGKQGRILITEGDESIWAGARVPLPRIIPLDQMDTYSIVEAAFKGEYKGLDPSTLRPLRTTTPSGITFLRDIKSKALGEKLKQKGGLDGKVIKKRKKVS